ncbi:MAG TPA: hypothetical protein VMT52_05160 [Planctomycetota bacterium]|nr:hypothetical protein [Planctomycetota bacterium]
MMRDALRNKWMSWMGPFLGCIILAVPQPAGAAPPGLPAIVFVSRDFTSAPDPVARPGAIERAHSGKLLVREVGGAIRALLDSTLPAAPAGAPADVADPDVHFDGKRIVFSGYSEAEGGWRIFEVCADGTGFRQVTRSDRQLNLAHYGAAADLFKSYDDVDPCYLPGGRICFVSTRYPGFAPDGRTLATNLYVVNEAGGSPHRITTERFGADTPAVEPSTGRIVYSRWWRTADAAQDPTKEPPEPIPPGSPGYGGVVVNDSDKVLIGVPEKEFPGVNSWFLAGINPDGTEMAMWSGFRLDRALTQAYRPSFLASGEALALFIPQTPFINYPRGSGLRRFSNGPGLPVFLGGPQEFSGVNVDPRAPLPFPVPPLPPASSDVHYASSAALPDGRILVTAALPPAPGDYGVFVQANGDELPPALVGIHNDPSRVELDAVPLLPRPVPPVVADRSEPILREEAPRTKEEAFAQGGSFVFKVENIHFNAPVGVPMPNAPAVGNKLAIEFYMNPQRTSATGSDAPILIHRQAIPVDGKIEVTLPAGVPLFEVLKRPDGTIPLSRDGQIFHVGGMNFGRAGEISRCVGCHTGHSQMAVPINADFSWNNVAPSAFVVASSQRLIFLDFARDPAGNGLALPFKAFRPVNLVDRRLDSIESEWAAENEPISTVRLQWTTTLRAREAVIYGPAPGAGFLGERSQVIRKFHIATSLRGEQAPSREVPGPITPEGTHVALDSGVEFDSLIVTIHSKDVEGLYETGAGPALAEVEVIAQVTGEPSALFVRGDADGNADTNLGDLIHTLSHLFLGEGELQCEAAADVNNDGVVDISDAMFQGAFLFQRGPDPSFPFPACGPSTTPELSCEISPCS